MLTRDKEFSVNVSLAAHWEGIVAAACLGPSDVTVADLVVDTHTVLQVLDLSGICKISLYFK